MIQDELSIVYFGTEDYSCGLLESLLEAGYTISNCVTKKDSFQGRGQSLTSPPLKIIATQNNIPVLQPSNMEELSALLPATRPDIGVLVAYGKIIPRHILEMFTYGIINIHPSLLPKYRGPAPIEAAILNGDKETGVTLMKLEPGMDTGPIYAQSILPLSGKESRKWLYQELFETGSRLLIDALPKIISGSLIPVPQNNESASLTYFIKKSDGNLDLSKPAEDLERQIRAYNGWPNSRIRIHGTDVIVTASHVESAPESLLTLPTSRGYLAIDKLKPIGKKEMSSQDFLRGRKNT